MYNEILNIEIYIGVPVHNLMEIPNRLESFWSPTFNDYTISKPLFFGIEGKFCCLYFCLHYKSKNWLYEKYYPVSRNTTGSHNFSESANRQHSSKLLNKHHRKNRD